MRFVLLHYHILKNGGSSIEEILRASFWERWMALDKEAHDSEVESSDLVAFLNQNPRVEAISSHQIFYPVPKVTGYLFFDLCFLRDPIDRLRSIYDYFREKPSENDPMRQLARRHTLPDFIRRLIDEMPWTVNDVQVNLLAHGIVNDQPRGAEDLALATQRMMDISFLGVVDLFQESLLAGQHRLSVVFPTLNCATARVNTSAEAGSTLSERQERFREACGDDLYSELVRLNSMDFELLNRARAEVRRRLESVPDWQVKLGRLKDTGTKQAGNPRSAPRRANAVSRETPPTTAFTRLIRVLRFGVNWRAMRPRSEFRRVFDADFYLKAYADVAASGVNPLWHFVTLGAFEGRNPSPLFDTSFYLGQCGNPPRIGALSHYLQRGRAQGLRPHPLFDSVYYLRRYPEVQRARMNPLVHYVLHGFSEGRKPNPLFEPDYYLKVCPSARGRNPLVHFAESDPSQCCSPHPLFDCQAYRREHPESAGNPLASYLTARSRSLDAEAGAPATFDAAQFAIQEVEVLVAFPGPGFEQLTEAEQQRIYAALQAKAKREGFSGEVAALWRTVCGRKLLCAPQQRRFFECTPFDQLAAQINRHIEIGAATQIR